MYIAIPSFTLLYSMDEVVDPAVTVEAVGHRWYWSYEYSDYNQSDKQTLRPMLSTGRAPEGGRCIADRVLEPGAAGHTLHDPGRALGADHGLDVSHSSD